MKLQFQTTFETKTAQDTNVTMLYYTISSNLVIGKKCEWKPVKGANHEHGDQQLDTECRIYLTSYTPGTH